MGLDIYLYEKAQQEAGDAHEKAWDEVYESGRWEAMTEAEQSVWRDENPWPGGYTTVKSERYPDHLLDRRYLRSSYNGGGFNRAVPEMTGTNHDLYWIFEPARGGVDEYETEFTSASISVLRECRERALQVAEELRTCDRLRVATVESNPFSGSQHLTDDGAMEVYRKFMAGRPASEQSSWLSGRDGEFFVGGFEFLAAIPAVHENFMRQLTPCVYLIYRQADEGLESYVQSAEITAEFCDEAIVLIERDGSVFMHWSG